MVSVMIWLSDLVAVRDEDSGMKVLPQFLVLFIALVCSVLLFVLGLTTESAAEEGVEHWESEPVPALVVTDCFSKGALAIKGELLGETCLLLLDSGTMHSVLHHRWKERFAAAGIRAHDTTGFVGAAGEKAKAEVFSAPSITVNGVTLSRGDNLRCLPSGLPTRRHHGEKVDGYLGIDVLRNYRLLVDYDTKTIKFWPALQENWTPPDWASVPLTAFAGFGDDMVYGVNASAGDCVAVSFLVDTGGAGECALSQKTFREWKATGHISSLGKDQFTSVGGLSSSEFGRLRDLRLGEFHHRKVQVTALKWNLLGRGYFWQFVCLFDFPGSRLYLKPGKRFGRGNCSSLDGLELPPLSYLGALFSPAMRVLGVQPGSPAERLGLQKGDLLLTLGDLKLRSYPLSVLYRHVRWSDADNFELRVDRNDEEMTLSLTVEKGLARRVPRSAQCE